MNRKRSVRNRMISIVMSCMLVLGVFPSVGLSIVSAAQDAPVYAAAYMGATTTAGTTLPENVSIDGQSAEVAWHIGDDTFAVPYETVTVTGTADEGASVAASVMVVPPAANPLAYFVDSGRGGDSVGNGPTASPLYEAVKELSGSGLINRLPDQKYASGSTEWGLDDSVQKVKNSKDGGHTDPAIDPSIWVVGLRSATDHIVYQLKALEPGTYTLSSGFHDWYGSRSRVMQPRLEYKDTDGIAQTIALDTFNTNAGKMVSGEFTIPDNIDTSDAMTLTYAYVSNEKPILSWFAIAEGGIKQLIEDARASAASMVQVLLDGNDINAGNVNGLTFKGFGVLTGNSSSALLMDYKSEHPEAYAELLQILFGGDHPIMTHVKIEMGNDRNNSTGPDPATMRTADEEANVTRHPGFQLAADAKAVNPDLKVSILRWSAPAWANDNDRIYDWYKGTILAAYREYGYMVDYVNPHINEHAPDLAWSKQFSERVRNDSEGFATAEEKALYNKMETVISDEVGIGSFGGSMVNDASLRDAVSVAAYHYNTDDDGAGNFKRLAEQFDVEVWNSEAQATFSNSAFRPNNNTQDPVQAGTGIGGINSPLEMGNTIIKGFVNSRRTHFIYQPAIGSFYEGGQYSFKELVSARDPWSGWIHYDAGLDVLRHFSSFANVGWENETNTAGIWRAVPKASYTGATGTNPVSGRNGTPSYITLAAPDKTDFSTVIINDSEYERTYKLQTVNMGYAGTPSLNVWETRAAEEGAAFNSNYLKYRGAVAADGGGVYTVAVKPYSIVTVTTLDQEADELAPLPVEGERIVLDTDATGAVRNTEDHVLYADDFDYSGHTVPVIGADGQIAGSRDYIASRGGTKSVIPRYTHDRNGAFEAYLDDATGNYVLRQQLDRAIMGLGGTWNGGDPVTAIGDYRWTNYKASADVSFENNSTQSGANYAAIGARYQGGGSSHSISGTPYVLKFWFDGGWQLVVDNGVAASGNVAGGSGVQIAGFDTAHDAWHNIAIQVAGDQITAYLDDVELASYSDPNPKLSGRVDLASGYYHVRFDNLLVETVDGYTPYYSEALDNLEMHDLAAVPAPKLIYGGAWAHRNGLGMYNYQRSMSTSQAAGSMLTYTFTGTGLDILGPNDGSAKLETTVDGVVAELAAGTKASKELYQTYALRGLKYGGHTVQIKVLSGTLAVDAVAVVSGAVKGAPRTSALQAALTDALDVAELEEFGEADWQLFAAARDAAQAALADTLAYRLDQEGADQLAARLVFARNQLYTGDVRGLASPHYGAVYVGGTPALPAQVEATLEDGSKTFVTVNWRLNDVSFDTAYQTVAVTGTYGSLQTVAYVEVVPEDIAYFVDLNATEAGLTAGHSASSTLGYDSPAYLSVKALAAESGKPLLNDAPDQVYGEGKTWGHGGYNANETANVSYKGISTGPYSKQSTTGIYTGNQIGAYLTYTFDEVPAGEYTLTLGSYSWWASYARTQQIYIEHDGQSEHVDTYTLDGSSFDVVKGYDFALEEAGTVRLKLVAAQSAQSPMLSFVGLAPIQNEPEPDNVKPVITLLGNANVTLAIGDSYTDAGATAADDRDGDITANIVTTITRNGNNAASVDTTAAGTYVYHFNVNDAAGNAAEEVARTVTVAAAGATPAPTTESPTSTPTPTPTPTPTMSTIQDLTEDDLARGADGTVTAELPEGKDTVKLPARVSDIVGDNTLRLVQSNMTIELSGKTLQEIAEAGSATDGMQIQLTVKSVPKAETERRINHPARNGTVRLTPASEVVRLGFEVVGTDGAGAPVTELSEPVVVSFNVDKTLNPDLLGVYLIAEDGTVEYLGGTLDGGIITVQTDRWGQLAVLEYDKSFEDVGESFWAKDVIRKLTASHIIQGVSDTAYNPQGNVTRAEFAALIARALGLTSASAEGGNTAFEDVEDDAWYASHVAAASEAGIVRGRSAEQFAPHAEVTREEMAVMLIRAYEYAQGGQAGYSNAGTFVDGDQISDWALTAVNAALEAGLIDGRGDDRFAPKFTMTRAESAQAVFNLLNAMKR